MIEDRLPDYLGHIHQAAADACAYVEGMSKAWFRFLEKSALAGRRAR
jgi:hypothetical protein